MIKVKWKINTGFSGGIHEGVEYFPDDAKKVEIEEEMQTILNEYCSMTWEIE